MPESKPTHDHRGSPISPDADQPVDAVQLNELQKEAAEAEAAAANAAAAAEAGEEGEEAEAEAPSPKVTTGQQSTHDVGSRAKK